MRSITTATTGFLLLVAQLSFSQNTSVMDKNKNYSVEIIRYVISADQRASFEKAYENAAAILQASPYCLGYEIIHGTDEHANYIVRIHWTSVEDHLNGFRKSREFASFFNLVKPFYSAIQEMKHYEMTAVAWSR